MRPTKRGLRRARRHPEPPPEPRTGTDVLLLPVGHGIGAFHAGDGVTEPVQQVRLGGEIAELSETEFLVWSLAHGLVDEQGRSTPCTTAGLLELVDEPGVLGALAGRGLLAEVVPGSTGALRFAVGHRLLPLATGLGNTAARPWTFSVGLLHEPVLEMSGALFDVWQWGHLSPDLRAACAEAAAVAVRAGVDDPDRTDPERAVAGVLAAVHQLLAARVACLDVRIEGLR